MHHHAPPHTTAAARARPRRARASSADADAPAAPRPPSPPSRAQVQIALVSLVWYAVLGPLAEAMQHGTKPWSQSHYINEFIGVASGECLSKPPKINYIVLCICMTIAIGVRAPWCVATARVAAYVGHPPRAPRAARAARRQMETIDRVFIVALCMVAVGIALSILTSIMPAAPSEGESMRAGQSRDEGGRSAEMR